MERNRSDYLKLIATELKRSFLGDGQLNPSSKDIERISEATHVSDKTLRKILGGSHQAVPHVGTLDALCKALGYTSFDEFVANHQKQLSHFFPLDPNEDSIAKMITSNDAIRASFEFNKQEFGISQPLLVPIPYAASKAYWKNWAFCEAIITAPLSIQQINTRYRLTIELKETDLAIYNNAGKRFLEHHYKIHEDNPKELERFFSGETNQTEYVIRSSPIRWSSGGVLPIVSYRARGHEKKSDWVLLFWRDLSPKAWTIPLGGAHNHHELTNLTKLVFREFSEEVLLLDRHPSFGNVFQKYFVHPDRSDNDYISTEFTRIQRQLRKSQDQLNISLPQIGREVEMDTVRTNMEVLVNGEITRSVIISVNPMELGIEVVKVVRFEMDDNDYILDGEFSEHESPFLIRRPAALVNLKFLERIYRNSNPNSLGIPVTSDNASLKECMDIVGVGSDDLIFFDHELHYKKSRGGQLLTTAGLVEEKEHSNRWRNETDFDKQFLKVEKKTLRLSPTVWKTLTRLFQTASKSL